MRLPMNPEFRAQWEAFGLRFCCEDCVYLVADTGLCAHGWPASEHRLARYTDPACQDIVFCKEFELS